MYGVGAQGVVNDDVVRGWNGMGEGLGITL